MPVMIRLMRFGKRKSPSYRIVAIDKRKKRDGSYIENLGNFNPMQEPVTLEFKKERVQDWIGKGAQMSDTVRNLLKGKLK
ncbi:MAG: 30S ribosomal protein S16 [bacterium]|nr:30S ribosomal protein S16 [bacterium]